jgi:hypothetical protein
MDLLLSRIRITRDGVPVTYVVGETYDVKTLFSERNRHVVGFAYGISRFDSR